MSGNIQMYTIQLQNIGWNKWDYTKKIPSYNIILNTVPEAGSSPEAASLSQVYTAYKLSYNKCNILRSGAR